MEPEAWRRIDHIFAQALEVTEAERSDWLRERYAEEPELQAAVERLLALDAEAKSFLEDPAVAPPRAEDPAETMPEQVGPYRLLQLLGAGGMGRVYLGERSDQYRGRAAIKLLHAGLENETHRLRFQLESQALADLEHPNIARLYDGGTTEEGLPYLVMEHVRGMPLDVYCDHYRLPIDRRLEIFLQVSAAVEHAHRNLVIHRDLKPSNILVTADGSPKLLDFGIAKWIQAHHEKTLTHTGSLLMTPGYASPEQVRGQVITTGSDVFSLGILLYLLLTGSHPFLRPGRTPYEISRNTCELDPTPPSQVSLRAEDADAAPGASPEVVAGLRQTRPETLHRQLRGDLDAIVLKALRKDPAERYPSVRELIRDLQRFREQRPVLARKSSLRDRAVKFLHRNRLASAAATLLLVMGIAAFFAIAHQADRATRQRDRASQVSQFLVELFEVSSPDAPVGADLTARQLLDLAAERFRRESRSDPDVHATLLETMGQIYFQLGFTTEGEAMLHEALDARRQLKGAAYRDRATPLTQLATLEVEDGRLDEAEARFREVLSIRQAEDPTHPDVADALNGLALIEWRRGDLETTRELLQRTLDHRLDQYGPRHRSVAQVQSDLAAVLMQLGELDEAEPFLRAAYEVRKEILGDQHLEMAVSFDDFARLHYQRGEFLQAAERYRQILEIRQRFLPASHPLVLRTNYELARALQAGGHLDVAEELLQEVIAKYRETAVENHSFAVVLNELAILLGKREKFREARALFEESLALRIRIYGKDHPDVAQSHYSLANLLHDLKDDLEEAEHHYREATDLIAKSYPPDHPAIAYPMVGRARLACDRGQPVEALELLDRSLERLASSHPPGHWRLADARSTRAGCLLLLDRFDEAEALLAEAYPVLAEQRGMADPATRRARSRARALFARHAPATADGRELYARLTQETPRSSEAGR